MEGRENNRFYEVKFGAETEFAILPGENPLEFELLHTRLAEEWAPDGPLEEDALCTMAKCIWRKRRYQRFNAAKNTAAQFDPDHKAYDEAMALNGFYQVLLQETAEHELRRMLGRLGGHFAEHLRNKCPKPKFKVTKAWVKAMRREIENVLMPAATRFGSPPDEVLMSQSAAFLTDEVFARELEFEKQLEAELKEARNQLFEIKKAKRQIQFREIRRFERRHPSRLSGIIR
jgi:hypothetical protein